MVPAEVEAFLAEGEPPVLLTFGSMLAGDAPETHACIEAMLGPVEQAGVRAIVQVRASATRAEHACWSPAPCPTRA